MEKSNLMKQNAIVDTQKEKFNPAYARNSREKKKQRTGKD